MLRIILEHVCLGKSNIELVRAFPRLDDVANGENPRWTYSIVRLNKGIIDCHNLHITVLDAVNRISA